MSKKMCEGCQIRKADPSTAEGMFCTVCDELGGWENSHSDWDHDGIASGDTHDMKLSDIRDVEREMKNCWVCHPELVPGAPKQGHTNTAAKSYSSHANCDHARTPKAREICRRARRAS